MALTAQEYSEMADLAAELGDDQAELQALEGLEQAGGLGQPEGQSIGDIAIGAADIAGATLAGAGRQMIEGITGVGGLAMGRGVDRSVAAAKALTEQIPKFELGEQGQALVQTISEQFKASPDLVQEIAKTFINLGPSLGEKSFQATGSPLVGAVVGAVPGAIEAATGLGGARAAAGVTRAVAPIAEAAAETGKELTTDIFQYQSPAKRKIAQLIEEGVTDIETARFKLAPPGRKAPAEPTSLQKFLGVGEAKVVGDPLANNAIKQGFDEGVIASVKGGSISDKLAMRKMVNIAERTKKNKLFGMDNRGSDVTGDLLMSRLRIVQKSNRDAGIAINKAAKSLKGKTINVAPAADAFVRSLDDMGITLKQVDGKQVPDFKGSDIEGLAGPENVIKRTVKRMTGRDAPDAFEAHRLKRFIDEQVTFGKNAEGLAGKSERVLKTLRRDLDTELDNNFPVYNEANTQYSETIKTLDAFQDVAGKKMNLTGDNADKATGTLMRRLMGNAQSRIRLLDSIKEIETAVKKFGGKLGETKLIEGPGRKGFENNLKLQVLFADELDAVFGPAARTSLQGQFDQALKTSARAAASRGGAAELAIDIAGGAVEKARGINEAGAFKAIKELLKENK